MAIPAEVRQALNTERIKLAAAEIPPDEERWSVRDDMRRRTREKVHAILESLPLYSWMTISVRSLAPHPNDPVRLSDGGTTKH